MQKRFNPGGSVEGYCDHNEDDVLLESSTDDIILGKRLRAVLQIPQNESEDLAESKGHPEQLALIQAANSSHSRADPSHSHPQLGTASCLATRKLG